MENNIAVVYTARGSNVGSGPPDWRARFPRFIKSYLQHQAGIDHRLYIFYKEFATAADLAWAREQFAVLGKRVELLSANLTGKILLEKALLILNMVRIISRNRF